MSNINHDVSNGDVDNKNERVVVIQFIEGLKDADRPVKSNALKELLVRLSVATWKSGLSDEEMNLLVHFLDYSELKAPCVSALIKCLVPTESVTPAVICRFLGWLFSYYEHANTKVVILALRWLLGVLEYDLIESDAVRKFYSMYYGLLQYEGYQPIACKLLCVLTKPLDVTKFRVNTVLKLQNKYGPQKYFAALLSVFKRYRPSLVTKKVQMMETFSVRAIEEPVHEGFKMAQHRISAAQRKNAKQLVLVDWSSVPQLKRKRSALRESQLIPTIQYTAANVPPPKRQKTLDQIESFDDLCLNLHNVVLPSDVMALLANDIGLHVLAFGGAALQGKFSYALSDRLDRAFLNPDLSLSYAEKDHLLGRVVALLEYLNQGVPVVSVFLSCYLLTWDGLDHKEHVLKLVKWTTFSCYAELRSCVLKPLYELFVCSGTDMQLSIIDSLIGLITNMYLVDIARAQAGWEPIFIGGRMEWSSDPVPTVMPLTIFVQNLCQIGLQLHKVNDRLLLQAIFFSETVSLLEQHSGLAIWTLPTPKIIYCSLFARNSIALNKVCRLLIRYQNIVVPKLEANQMVIRFNPEIETFKSYMKDFLNFLYFGKAVDKRKSGLIFSNVPRQMFYELNSIIDVNTMFDISHHLSFSPFIKLFRSSLEGVAPLRRSLPTQECLELIEPYANEIADLIKNYLEKNQNLKSIRAALYSTTDNSHSNLMLSSFNW